MKRSVVAGVVALSALVSQAAWAQDMGSAPPPPDTQTESVNMQMSAPGMGPGININMQVQHSATPPAPAPQPQPQPQPAAYVAPAPPPAAYRDCGTGQDPGCTMTRRGQLPMDADEFNGFMQALRSNANELEREDMVKASLGDSFLTARQLAQVLDLFENEITRYEVAEVAAPKLVNPKHALGLSSKFQNSIYASDFTQLMAKQRE